VVASNYVDAAPDLTVATYFTSQTLMKSNPESDQAFTEAMAESLSYADAHPDDVRRILASYTRSRPTSRPSLCCEMAAQVNSQSVRTLADLAVSDGLLDKYAEPLGAPTVRRALIGFASRGALEVLRVGLVSVSYLPRPVASSRVGDGVGEGAVLDGPRGDTAHLVDGLALAVCVGVVVGLAIARCRCCGPPPRRRLSSCVRSHPWR